MKLAEKYQIIGNALCKLEQDWFALAAYKERIIKSFTGNVAIVNTETLESYLEDLLNLNINEEKLFIRRKLLGCFLIACLTGLLAGFCLAIFLNFTVIVGLSFSSLLFLSSIFGIVLSTFWQFFPQKILRRRFLFAHVLSQEISNRRGRGQKATAKNSIRKFLQQDFRQASGFAKEILH